MAEPANDFSQWFFNKLKKSRNLIGGLGIVSNAIFSVLLKLKESNLAVLHMQGRLPLYEKVSYAVHASVILLILVRFVSISPKCDERHFPAVSEAGKQFDHFWKGAWASWFFLYLCTFLQKFLDPAGQVRALSDIACNLMNNLSAYFFFMCYFVLARRTVDTAMVEASSELNYHRVWRLPFNFVLAQQRGVKVVSIKGISMPLTSMALPSEWCFVIPIGLAAIELIFYSHGLSDMRAMHILTWSYGCVGGMILALFVGRLDSTRIGPPLWILAMLYFYAVIQASWGVFLKQENVHLAMTNIALPLKLVLASLVYWLYDEGILLYYLKNAREVFKRIPTERQEFLREHFNCESDEPRE